jgi:prefoldin subunit 5
MSDAASLAALAAQIADLQSQVEAVRREIHVVSEMIIEQRAILGDVLAGLLAMHKVLSR